MVIGNGCFISVGEIFWDVNNSVDVDFNNDGLVSLLVFVNKLIVGVIVVIIRILGVFNNVLIFSYCVRNINVIDNDMVIFVIFYIEVFFVVVFVCE